MSRPNIQTNEQDQFEQGLRNWIDESPEGERENREKAVIRMRRCKSQNSINLDLSGLELTSLPPEIAHLTSLRHLDLISNQLQTFPPEIAHLTSLRSLNLTNNQLQTLPEITHLTSLERLNLTDNQLQTFPPEITHLTSLKSLDLTNNQLQTLPPEIGNLTALQNLYLSGNQLQTFPPEIAHLTSLEMLYLANNELRTLPPEIVNLTSLQRLDLEGNHITYEEAQRLNQLTQGRFTLSLSIYQPPTVQNAQQQSAVKTSILDLYQTKEERAATEEFLSSDNLRVFNRFLSKCSEAAGWLNPESRPQMTEALHNIINKMKEDEHLVTKCLVLAETGLGTCGDRAAVSYVQMILAANTTQKPVSEMTTKELFEYSKQESVTKFLNDKAKTRVEEIKTRRGFDEIETYLAYLQVAPILGVNLPASAIYFEECSNVTKTDLKDAEKEFKERSLSFRAAEHAYNDDLLKTHPLIQAIITAENNRDDLDLSPKEGETDAAYSKRIEALQNEVINSIIAAIQNNFEESIKSYGEEETKSEEYKSYEGEEEYKSSESDILTTDSIVINFEEEKEENPLSSFSPSSSQAPDQEKQNGRGG